MFARFVTGLGSLVSALLLIGAAVAEEPQDPPGRVGRLSYIEGAVQQRTADNADWTRAGLNHPVTNGFAVATQEGGRAEIQVGSMAIHIGNNSELDVNELADHGATLTLAQGEINVRLGRLANGDRIEIVTPRGIVHIVQDGQYHVDAGSTESPTRVAVFNGKIEVPREGGPTIVTDSQAALITGDDPLGITIASAAADPLDDWARSRDRPTRITGSRHVSPEMTGGGDLDDHGYWRHDPQYGEMWVPQEVPPDWAPYRYGHWDWVSPWGWTWIDDQPWGFAPFHYGRWVYGYNGWGWVPGLAVDYPIYAPALVGFVGSPGFVGVGFPFVSWFPLAPFEVFVPAFPVSIAFVRNINITNVNITNINVARVNGNIVVNNVTNVTVDNFANGRFVTTVSTTTFSSGQSINGTSLTQSTIRVAGTTPVSFAPTNVTAPRTAASVNGVQSAGAGMTAARPSLPMARTTGGSSTGTATVATGTNTAATTTAGTGPSRRSLPPLPGSSGAQSTTADTAHWSGGKTDAASATAPTGHKLPPLPAATPHTTTTSVSVAPTNVAAPRTAASVNGVQSAGAGMAAAKPPLPMARTNSGGPTGTGTVATGTNTAVTGIAGTDPSRRSLPPLPGSSGAQSTMAGTAHWAGGKTGTVTPTTASGAAGGSTHSGGASHVAPLPTTSRPPRTGSPTVLNATRPGNSPPQMRAPSMHAPATTGSFSHPPNMSMMPGGAHGMPIPRGVQAQPRGPSQHGGRQAQRMNNG